MRPFDRISIIDHISEDLANRWSYSNINSYLAQYKIKLKNPSEYPSRYDYCLDVLQDVSEQIILEMVSELKIKYQFQSDKIEYSEGELKFWKSGHFKLFVSHISSFKENVSHLKIALEPFGISSFVAHEDIEPTKEWMIEIEKALASMDAMLALLLPGFHESNWTDQEIGIAIGKQKLIIPITKELDPYGFLGKYQGFKANGKKIGEVASTIFNILCSHDKTKNQILNVITDLFLIANRKEDATQRLSIIENAQYYSKEFAEKLAERVKDNRIIIDDPEILNRVNVLLSNYGLQKVMKPKGFSIKQILESDDLPF
jgi:hypothetical protein